MTYKHLCSIICFLCSFNGFSQQMEKGFTYLENGNYAQAEVFFEEVLKAFPKNKTARLCYGRAIGLNENAPKAVSLFTALLNEYPNDFEIKLNYAEALLWNTDFNKAKSVYQDLVQENDQSFSALLGYANCLSNLKEYENAFTYVEKALEVSPNNTNALNSKKYMYLGAAYQKQQSQAYTEAETIVHEGLVFFENDTDLLQNLANLYLIMGAMDKAENTYNTLGMQPNRKTTALNGLALVAHLNGKDKKALQISTEAYTSLHVVTDKKVIQQTKERYVQALIWNKKFTEATTQIDSLQNEYPNENWILALRATLNTYKSDFKKSLADYEHILQTDSTSFDGNLGKANTLKALGNYKQAYQAAEKTLRFHNKQKDALNFIQQLDKSFTPTVTTNAAHSFDNGNNKAYMYGATLLFPVSTKLKLTGNYHYRETKNTETNNEATANNFLTGFNYAIKPNLKLKTNLGITDVTTLENEYTQLLTDVSLSTKPYKLQTLDVGYKREWQNFNADLIGREIDQNTLYANYNVSTNCKLGWYTQYQYTWQNDDNMRNLLFTSLYYNVLAKPFLKVGVNYQYISFKNQVPTLYFSPESFNVYEVFADLLQNQKGKLSYNINAATGYQFIEDQDAQHTYRLQGKLGYVFTERFKATAYGLHSNIASATAAGFTYTEFGVRLQWYFLKKPVFS